MTDASLSAAVLESSGAAPPVPWQVIEACGLPEIGPGLAGLSVRLDPALNRPFRMSGTTVVIHPDHATTVTGSALILREAIELSTVGFDQAAWADRILAHATALTFGTTTLASRVEPAALHLFSPLAEFAADIIALSERPDELDAARAIAARIARFLERRDEPLGSCPEAELARAARGLPFSPPTQVLIAGGGDDRQTIDWQVGANTYGIAPIPTPWTASFGSCTASSLTSRAFDAASRLRRGLVDAALSGELDRTVAAHTEGMRKTLLAALGVTDPAAAEVVFTPSGTDAELVALVAALGAGEPVHTVVVGQHEIGSGSVHAATGRHFASRVPSDRHVLPGAPIAGLDDSQLTISTVDLRDNCGDMLEPAQVETAVEQAIETHAGTHRTLLHVVEGSKTGIRLPRVQAVRRWQERYGSRLDVVVDAAQMRIDQHTVVDYLSSDALVIVTGSKFFGGPPFSGAVLIPASMTSRLAGGRQLPGGLSDYLTSADVPETLDDLHAVARPSLNPGLLLRWEAALAEMRSFHNVSPEIRDEVLRLLASGLRRIIERASQVTLIESPYTPIPENDHRGLDDLPTIFTFVSHAVDGTPLALAQCERVHQLLAEDLHGIVPSDDPVVRRTYRLGRPVKIYRRDDEWIAGLRIAIGAPTVSEIVFDYTRGRTWTERIDRTLADIADALRKLSLILRHANLGASSPDRSMSAN